jgi:hypothetical protein
MFLPANLQPKLPWVAVAVGWAVAAAGSVAAVAGSVAAAVGWVAAAAGHNDRHIIPPGIACESRL